MNTSDKRAIGILATVISASLFGCMPLFVKIIASGGGNSLMITFLRFFVSLPALYLFLKRKRVSLSVTKNEFMKLLLLTLVGYSGTPALLFASYNYIPSGMATTIHFCYPAFTIIGCILFLKQKPQPAKLLSIMLCIIGILLFYNGSGNSENALLGMGLSFLSSITYSFYVIYLEASGLQKLPTFKTIFYMHLIATPFIGILTYASGSFTFALTGSAWAVMIFMAIALCFISVYGFQIGVKYIGPSTATILSTFEPITSLIIGIVFFHEVLYMKNIIGCIAILAATIIIGTQKE